MLILASQSPRRQHLLQAAGFRFRVIVPTISELPPGPAGGSHAAFVKRAALRKARSVPAGPRDLVLAADTIVVCEGQLLGKPSSRADARRTLQHLSGRRHRVYTGLALVSRSEHMVGHERTEVTFRSLSQREIEWYVGTGEPMDKAGAYAIQGEGAALVRVIRGCYTNVIGLPIPKLTEMLAAFRRRLGVSSAKG